MEIKVEPPEPDWSNIRKPRQLRRVLGWGGAAAIALAAVVITGQTQAGSQRLHLAIGYLSDPARVAADLSEPVRAVAQIPSHTAQTEAKTAAKTDTKAQAETQRLAVQVHDLAADRERLTARIAMLERNLDDMTGSIKQQSEQLAAARTAVSRRRRARPPPRAAGLDCRSRCRPSGLRAGRARAKFRPPT